MVLLTMLMRLQRCGWWLLLLTVASDSKIVAITIFPTLPALPFDYGYGSELDHLFGYAGGVAGVDHLAHVLVALGGLLHHLIVITTMQ